MVYFGFLTLECDKMSSEIISGESVSDLLKVINSILTPP